jgi:hypothetical protein
MPLYLAYLGSMAQEILETWFGVTYQPNDEDERCPAQVEAIEQKYQLR